MEQNINPYLLTIYELRFRVNKFNHEVIGSWYSKALAYGMRKKLIQEQPSKYPFNKLIVKTIKPNVKLQTKK